MSGVRSRGDIVEGVASYFRSNQWQDLIGIVQDRGSNHMHVYVDTGLDPRSLARVVTGYFEQRGWSLYREPDYFGYKPGHVSLYGIFPDDKINFEIFCRLSNETILAPMPPILGERGSNLCVWTEAGIRRHVRQFAWRDLDKAAMDEARTFFASGSHWAEGLDLVRDPAIVHVHCNIEGSVHPDHLRCFALADLEARGWRVKHAIHSVYNAGGKDQGKIVFLGLDPARTFDIAWYFNPEVLIRKNTLETHMDGHEGTSDAFFVLRGASFETEIRGRDLLTLDEEDVRKVLDLTAAQTKRSAYGWRFVPVDENQA